MKLMQRSYLRRRIMGNFKSRTSAEGRKMPRHERLKARTRIQVNSLTLFTIFILCIYTNFIFITASIPEAGASSLKSDSNHRHRLRHADGPLHNRARRHGKETAAPLITGYSIEETKRDGLPLRQCGQNLHKPLFTDCDSYNPTILEEEPLDTFVIQVQAVDLDDPDCGGTVEYSVVDNTKFHVDPQSGRVITKRKFDRDEPFREKEEYVTVRAVDNGNEQQLDAVCIFKVKISDINDNAPMFDKFAYSESVPRDTNVGDVIMRISATDIDDADNGAIHYSLEADPRRPSDLDYFSIISASGEVKLAKLIDDERSNFSIMAVATDHGRIPRRSQIALSVFVVGRNRKPPTFTRTQEIIRLPETYSDKSVALARIEARANDEEGVVFFELLNGQTDATNKEKIFSLEPSSETVSLLKLEGDLNYEAVTQYNLTIRAKNKHHLAAEIIITIEVEDENDEKPYFPEQLYPARILENEDVGTFVTRVKAIDQDYTPEFHTITYALKDNEENFQIDPRTGDITTRKEFDREQRETYSLLVFARDGAPAAKPKSDKPNERLTTIRIDIADKNDNSPYFTEAQVDAEIPEDADVNTKVVEVKAIDVDTASQLTYSIESGNVGNAFSIQHENSGVILVTGKLDYENITKYELRVKAWDSVNEPAYINVIVTVQNINDNQPAFEKTTDSQSIHEEFIPEGCIFRVEAYDPDIPDRRAPQNISYSIDKFYGDDHFSVDSTGCVKIVKELDRDMPLPYGTPSKQVRVEARDVWGTGLRNYKELNVTLIDINDNEPFLTSLTFVWPENTSKGKVGTLTADDYDSPENGPPFTFKIDDSSGSDIRELFEIKGIDLYTKKDNFDREQRKEYSVPILITDSGLPTTKSRVSFLKVIIGDENDNDMKPGTSKISVYKYKPYVPKPTSPFKIGRVYVDDPDDWDLPDKRFDWENSNPHPHFIVDKENGDITMKPSALTGTYALNFKVEESRGGGVNTVTATVHVTVKEVPEEAVDKSGSIRFEGSTKEQFIKPDGDGVTKADKLRAKIAKVFDIDQDNVDVFTIWSSEQGSNVFDVRYSAHGSPYYKAEKLDGVMSEHITEIERELGLNVLMMKVDECVIEGRQLGGGKCESSCTNVLTKKDDIPYLVYTNTSTFVGVHAFVEPKCTCASELKATSCDPNPCLHLGRCITTKGSDQFQCECDPGFDGPLCEQTSAMYEGKSYSWYRPISVCEQSSLEFVLQTVQKNALILYNGPTYKSLLGVTDFVSVELSKGHPILLINYGSGVNRIELLDSPVLADGGSHKIVVQWSPKEISMRVDACTRKDKTCYKAIRPNGEKAFLNVNGPLQIAGISFNPQELKSALNWEYAPTSASFIGCISNLTFNGEYYDLRDPSFTPGNVTLGSCDTAIVASASLSVDHNFILILLACIIVMLILVIGIVYLRRRQRYDEVKGDPHDDVRENIMNYSDEGGGEGDQTGYDMSVLMKPTNGPYIHSPVDKYYDVSQGQMAEPGDNPDIQSFLVGKQNKVDNDPEGLPYDDVRNYAYEGDGNSMGSLSSLASGTDDGDLNFDYLPTFGPRFKKLADMYGGQSSDDESYTGPPPEQWC